MCKVSSAPCTVPSSPNRPCRAMKARSKPSPRSSNSERSAGSKAEALTPRSQSAVNTALPDSREISRSEEGPPISTATRPKDAGSGMADEFICASALLPAIGRARFHRLFRAGPSHGLHCLAQSSLREQECRAAPDLAGPPAKLSSPRGALHHDCRPGEFAHRRSLHAPPPARVVSFILPLSFSVARAPRRLPTLRPSLPPHRQPAPPPGWLQASRRHSPRTPAL